MNDREPDEAPTARRIWRIVLLASAGIAVVLAMAFLNAGPA